MKQREHEVAHNNPPVSGRMRAGKMAATNRNRLGYGESLLLILLLAIPLQSIVPAFGYLGEVSLAAIFLYATISWLKTRRIEKDWLIILTFLVIAISASAIFGVYRPLPIIALQGWIYCKFFVFYYFIERMIKQGHLTVSRLQVLFSVLLGISLIAGLINIVWGSGYYETFGLEMEFRSTDLVPRLGGAQLHPNHFSRTLFCCLFVLVASSTRFSLKGAAVIVVVLLFIYLTGSRVGLAAAGVILFFYVISTSNLHRSVRISLAVFLIMVIGIQATYLGDSWIVLTTKGNLEGIGSSYESSYIRGIMLYEGFVGALQNFPLGWGLATFGTSLSEDSPVYWQIGLATRRFVLEDKGIYDSNLGSVLGELGFGGLLFFSYVIWRATRRKLITGWYVPGYVRLASLTVFLLLFIVSPVFVNDYLALLLAVTLAYVRFCTAREQNANLL